MSDRLNELLDRSVVVTFRVQVITILAVNVRDTRIIEVLRLGEVEGEKVERLAVQ